MPAAFNACVKGGGRVRTISRGNSYIHVCFSGGKSYAGEVHHKKINRKPATHHGNRRR